jgi:protein involved in polysaccharide export with SLBB domain
MQREPIDRQSLLALVTETASKFPPQNDNDNARPFRLISVDYLDGKITHPQFNLLYAQGKTVEQITDSIVNALNNRLSRVRPKPGRVDETVSEKWRVR